MYELIFWNAQGCEVETCYIGDVAHAAIIVAQNPRYLKKIGAVSWTLYDDFDEVAEGLV